MSTPRFRSADKSVFKTQFHKFVLAWMAASLCLLFCVLIQNTLIARIVGASAEELQEAYDLASIPLGFISSWFVIRPGMGLLHASGVLIVNAYFYALVGFPVLKYVRYRLRESRSIELGIEKPADSPDECDELPPPR